MAIPRGITPDHILAAARRIDREGILPGRGSRKYHTVVNGRRYPPKLLVSHAAEDGLRLALDAEDFDAVEAVRLLRILKFVVESNSPTTHAFAAPTVRTSRAPRPGKIRGLAVEAPGHRGERCPSCKATVRALLETCYGRVDQGRRIPIHADGREFADGAFAEDLNRIHAILAGYRGFVGFTRADSLSACDWFIPDPGFIVEFDESQHFTACRRLALDQYPEDIELGFDRVKWARLCSQLNNHDPNPPDRDEQRAWYDTLRDFAPALFGFQPTVRLYASDFDWCSLRRDQAADLARFRELVELSGRSLDITFADIPAQATIARLAIAGPWWGEVDSARRLLEQLASVWPRSQRVDFLVTPGAFATFSPPALLRNTADRWSPPLAAVERLMDLASAVARDVAPDALRGRLAEFARYLTLGVDSRKKLISQARNSITEPHAELVVVMDLQTGKTWATGKSYPTGGQESTLVRVPDLASHFLRLDGRDVMVLGCHDLTMFNPRARANATGRRRDVIGQFIEAARERRPSVVLHHPHSTVKPGTWRNGWSGVEAELGSSVRSYAGAGRYTAEDSGWATRRPIQEVLAATATRDCIDIIVEPALGGV